METQALEGAFGVEVSGLNLGDKLSAAGIEALRAALLTHRLLVFRDQKLDALRLREFGRHFGSLDIHPYIEAVPGTPEVIAVVKEADEKHNFGGGWHSEVSFYEAPAMGTMLYAVDVPKEGGDTLLADEIMAYKALPDDVKQRIGDLTAKHSAEHIYGEGGVYQKRADGDASGTKTQRPETAKGHVEHPIVRSHPDTGEKILYVNLAFTIGITDLPEDEGRELLTSLVKHAVKPEFVTRLHWEPGTVAFWDNRCTQHYALNDYAGKRREMLRVVVAGDRPH